MEKKQKNVKMNKNLKNIKMEKKFKKAFNAIIVGVIVLAVFSIINIVLLTASLSGDAVAQSLATAMLEPIYELQAAIQKLKAGDFDIDIAYESQDELG